MTSVVSFRLASLVTVVWVALASTATGTTYFVSSSSGSDGNDGLTQGTAFATIAKVNSLALVAGDVVRFKCGDLWQGESLVVDDSGDPGNEITFTSDPASCINQPVISGSRAISGWSVLPGSIVVANLSSGANSGKFPNGVSQLFAGGERLPIGRWPNLAGHPDGGYSFIDSQPTATQVVDNELPAMSFTGAAFHHKSERWYLYNRLVTATSGTQLTLNNSAVCRNGCVGWGYYLTDHLNTLDSEGEWYFDPSANSVYLYTAGGAPADGSIEASFLPSGELEDQAGIIIGGAFPEHVSHVVVDNILVRNWAGNGIRMARLLRDDQNRFVTIRNTKVVDVGRVGILLSSYVYDAVSSGNGPNGWRGDVAGVVTDNVIDGANLYGIDTHSVNSLFEGNQILNIALIDQLTRDGMGCPFTGTTCAITGSGLRVSIGAVDQVAYSGSGNTIRLNRFSQVGMNGVDIFGPNNLVERNVIDEACSTLGDCGAVRTFGGSSFAATAVFGNVIRENIIRDTIGNTDGAADPLKDRWGLGVYIDHYSDTTTVEGNTVIGSTGFGIVFDHARGSIVDNTVYDNSIGSSFASHVYLNQTDTVVTSFQGNVVFGLETGHTELALNQLSNLSQADGNYYFNPRDPLVIRVQSASPTPWTLSEWRAASGHDTSSKDCWFTLAANLPDPSTIFVNDTDAETVVSLGGVAHVDLDQVPVPDSFPLAAFSSKVVIKADATDPEVFADGFESGTTSAWLTVN